MNNLLNYAIGKRTLVSSKTHAASLLVCISTIIAFSSIAAAQISQKKNNSPKTQIKSTTQPAKTIGRLVTPQNKQPTTTATKPSADGKYPKIRCDNPVYEFSDIWGGEKVEHTFTINNDGDAPLTIKSISTGCGCTVVKDYEQNIPPGGQTKLTFTVSTTTNSTKKTVSPTVYCNDPKTPSLQLTITGTVKIRIAIDPPSGADWGTINPNQKIEPRQIKITNNTTTPMKLQPVKQNDTSILAYTMKETEPGKVYELTITAKEPFKEGDNREYLNFNTGVPEQSQINIMCHVYLLPLVEVSPSSGITITLNDSLNRSKSSGLASIKYNGDGEMKIISAVADNPAIKVEVKTQKPGKLYYITAAITDDFNPNLQTKIMVTTDLKDKRIEIPFRTLRAGSPATRPVHTSRTVRTPTTRIR